MSNDEDEFGFSDSTAVDVGAQDYRSPAAAGLDAVPPPLPPGAVSEASSVTERQDNLPDWEDDDGNKPKEGDYYYKKTDLQFIEDARKAIKEGKKVYYNSWW